MKYNAIVGSGITINRRYESKHTSLLGFSSSRIDRKIDMRYFVPPLSNSSRRSHPARQSRRDRRQDCCRLLLHHRGQGLVQDSRAALGRPGALATSQSSLRPLFPSLRLLVFLLFFFIRIFRTRVNVDAVQIRIHSYTRYFPSSQQAPGPGSTQDLHRCSCTEWLCYFCFPSVSICYSCTVSPCSIRSYKSRSDHNVGSRVFWRKWDEWRCRGGPQSLIW